LNPVEEELQNKIKTNLIALSVIATLLVVPTLACADIIYDSPPFLGGGPYNYVPLADDGTPDRPTGSVLGNTITFGGTERFLTTFTIGLFNGGGDGPWTLSIYGGSDPNTAPLLGSLTESFGGGISPAALFDFTSQNIVLPNTITFTITSTAADNGHGPLSGLAPTTGTAPDSMWFGNGPGSFGSNTTWAIADGASTNLITAEISATPEPTSLAALLGMGTVGLVGSAWRKRRAKTA
jgi:hypothetical protein